MHSELSVHDNQIDAYIVDCPGRRLVLHTSFRDREPHEFTDIVFEQVLAHLFEHVLPGNILYDVEEVSLDQLLGENSALLGESWRYGWPPIEYGGDLRTLAAELSARSVRAYSISSSYGLSGWVLAGSCERRARQAPARPLSGTIKSATSA
jgi:hypothetical protein